MHLQIREHGLASRRFGSNNFIRSLVLRNMNDPAVLADIRVRLSKLHGADGDLAVSVDHAMEVLKEEHNAFEPREK